MQKPRDWREGMKHSSTAQTMRHLRVEVMELCEGAGLYQIDLLNSSKERVSEAEYWARRRGQLKLDRENAPLLTAGLQPTQTKFETVKDTLRRQISSVLYLSLIHIYGAMVSEGIIALIWAAAGCALYTITDGKMVGLAEALAAGQSAAIYDVCLKTMGNVGVALAMIGVVICPITSGDTAFRSARLTLADWLKIDQDSYANRLKLCIPVLGVGAFLGIGNALGFINYTVIWRYFSWTNQTLAMIVLWAASMYLFKEKKNFWITAVPATFMSAVSSTYFVLAPECLGGLLNSKTAEGATIYNTAVAYPIGVLFAVAMLAIFIHATKKSAAKA